MFQINSYREKQVILLMILDRKGYHAKRKGQKIHHIVVKNLPTLLKRITSKDNNGDFCCLNCLHSFSTKTNLNCIKKYVQVKIFVM